MPTLEVITRKATGNKKATPLLFVHGAWHGAWCWDRYFLPYFAEKGYDAHALSLRNHGNSESPTSIKTVRLSQYVEDVESIAHSLDSPPVVIGHSMGGFVLQKYLERNQPPGAVLFASAPPTGVFPVALKLLRQDPLRFVRTNLTMSLYPLMETPELAKANFFSESMPDDEVREYHAQLGDESFFAFLGMLFSWPKLNRIQTIPLVLGGKNDDLFPPKVIRATATAYNTAPVLFESTAHDMMLESTWKEIADHILGWLNENEL